MMQKTIRFSIPKDVTNPGEDAVVYLFPFTLIDSELIGFPEEERATTEHRLIVAASRTRLASWHLPMDDLIKVLFEIGRRKILFKIRAEAIAREERFTVNTATHPAECPFDPSRIPAPEGASFAVELEQPRIGFNYTGR
jgi:hypothetical protein